MTIAIKPLTATPVWSFNSDGTLMDIGSPDPQNVCFVEIARTLSGIRRFSGRGIPITQHLVMGAEAIEAEGGSPLETALYFLHDAHEWVFGDFIRPAQQLIATHLKNAHGPVEASAFDAAVGAIKGKWDDAIYEAAGLPVPEFWTPKQRKLVKTMDERMMRAEAIALFGPLASSQFPKSERPKVKGNFKIWGPAKAEERFVEMAYALITHERVVRQAAVAAAARALR